MFGEAGICRLRFIRSFASRSVEYTLRVIFTVDLVHVPEEIHRFGAHVPILASSDASRSPTRRPVLLQHAVAGTVRTSPLMKGWREHDWDEVLGYGLEFVDGIYGLLAIALFGVLVGFGAAVLLDIPRWLGVVAGGFLMPVLMLVLIWAVRRKEERS